MKRVDAAEAEAEAALQKKAQLEQEAQALAGQQHTAEQRAAALEREAEAHRKRTEVRGRLGRWLWEGLMREGGSAGQFR